MIGCSVDFGTIVSHASAPSIISSAGVFHFKCTPNFSANLSFSFVLWSTRSSLSAVSSPYLFLPQFPLSTVSRLFRILGKRWHGTLSDLTMGDLITPSYNTCCLDFFRILGKRWHGTISNLTMGDLITPERLALLVSVGTLVVVTIASVLTILFFTRWTYYWSLFCAEIMSETFSPQSFMTYIFIRNAWRRREVEEFTVEVTHMWKVHTQIKIQKGQILTYEN